MSETTTEPTPVLHTWKPTAKDLHKNYEIRLSIHDIGATVHIGCKTIAFSDISMAELQIRNWIDDPIKVYKQYEQQLNLEKIY